MISSGSSASWVSPNPTGVRNVFSLTVWAHFISVSLRLLNNYMYIYLRLGGTDP